MKAGFTLKTDRLNNLTLPCRKWTATASVCVNIWKCTQRWTGHETFPLFSDWTKHYLIRYRPERNVHNAMKGIKNPWERFRTELWLVVSTHTKHSDVVRLPTLIDAFQYTLTRSLSRASHSVQMTGVKQMQCFRDVSKVNLCFWWAVRVKGGMSLRNGMWHGLRMT